MYHPTDADHLKALKTQADGGADFGPSPGTTPRHRRPSTGGDLGWVAKGQLSRAADRRDLRDAGRQDLARSSTVAGDGSYLFKVLAEETRTPEGRQLEQLTATAFSNWYDAKKAAATITRDPTITASQHDQLGGRGRCSTRSSRRRGSAGDSIRRTASRWSPPRRSSATPIEPSRPLLDRPAGDAPCRRRARTAPRPLPGRAGPAGRDPLAVLRRLYPADHPVGRFGAADGADGRDARRGRARRPALPRPGGAGAGRRGSVGDALDRRPAARSPTAARGTASRPTPRCASTCSRRPTRSTTRSRPAPRRSWPASSATCGSRSSCTPSSRPRPASSTWPTSRRRSRSKIVRRHPHVFGDAVARTASDVNRQWERIKADERAAAAEAERRAGDDGAGRRSPARAPSTGSARRCRPSPPARRCRSGRPTSATTGRSIDGVLDKVAEEADELREAATDAERAEEFGDLLFVLVNVARRRGIEAEAAVRAANAKFRRRFASVERRRRRPGGRPARPRLRRARRAVGCCQG